MTGQIHVAVVDDHQLFRAGLIELLQTFSDLKVVAQGQSGAEAVDIARSHAPDVMLLDLDMPDTGSAGLTSFATAEAVRSASPSTRIVVLTMHDEAALVRSLVRAGASGYLIKSASRDELYAAITAAVRDDNSVLVSVSRSTANALSAATAAVAGPLTARELEVLRALAADGGTNRTIADELHIAEATVKRHLATIYDKLGAHTRVQAIRKARLHGFID